MIAQTPTALIPLHVLIVEDSVDDTLLLVHHLQRGGYAAEYARVESARDMRERLRERSWDLVLSDHQMPHFSMPEALAILNESQLDIPFIIVSGQIGDELAVAAMKGGAADFIPKSNLSRLLPSIRRELAEKQVRQARREADAHIRVIMDSARHVAIITTDLSGVITSMNRGAENILGYSAAELVQSQPPMPFHDPEQFRTEQETLSATLGRPATIGDIFQQWARAGVPRELTFIRKDGRRGIVLIMPNLLHDLDGNVIGTMGIGTEITERRQAEESLRDSEKRFRNITENMLDAVSVFDLHGILRYASPSVFTVHGYRPEEVVGRPLFELAHPEDRAEVERMFGIVAAGTSARLEFRARRASGQYQWLESVGNAIHDPSGAVSGVVISSRDITMRKQAQESLRESEERFRQMAENIEEVFWIRDESMERLIYISPAYEKMWGQSCTILYGNPRSFLDVVHPEDRPIIERVFVDKATRQIGFDIEYRVLQSDDSTRWVRDRGFPVRNEKGEVSRIVGVVEDVTDIKRERSVAEFLHRMDLHILAGDSLETFLSWFCKELVDIYAFPVAWIGRKEKDGSVAMCAHAGASKEVVESLAVRWNDTPAGRGPTGLAIRDNAAVWLDDSNEDFRAWRAWAGLSQYRSAIGLPLWVNGEVYGSLTIYSENKNAFAAATCKHLIDIETQLSVAIQRGLEQQQMRLQSVALSSAANAIFITDPNGRIEWVNESFCRLSGYSCAEVVGQTPRILKSGVKDADYYEMLWSTITAGEVFRSEMTERRKDGSHYIVQQTITPLRSVDGRVTHFVAIHEDITARKRAESQIEFQALHDALTGLPNRTVFQTSVPIAMAQAERKGNMLALMFLDLDQFKVVNDSLGHLVGDQLLQMVAERLRGSVRSTDIVARLGGDEFAIVQSDLRHVGGAAHLARKLLDKLAEPYEIAGHTIQGSASIGITLYPADQGDVDQLVRNADLAMYRAKREGRNNYQFYSPQMQAEVQQRLTLERELRQALKNGEFRLFFQPQVRDHGCQLTGLEALLRWQHPHRGLIGPGEFIRVAEESGLIVDIGRWVLNEGCMHAARWQEICRVPCSLAVNLSAAQFRTGDILPIVDRALRDSELDPHLLELEVTESLLMQDLEATDRTLHQLRGRGVRLAIDDFGTGYSSLAYLRRFPVQRLKIDQSFVRDIPASDDACAIVRAVVNLGHSLGLSVIAEGVETEEQHAFLIGEGCEEFQGYLFSKPLSDEAVRAWMLQKHGRRSSGTPISASNGAANKPANGSHAAQAGRNRREAPKEVQS